MRGVVKFLLLSEAFAVATFGLGWWSVPLIAALWGAFAVPPGGRARFAALCAATGWASLLLLDAARGPLSEVAAQIAGVMRVPSFALYVLTLLFPAMLAWSAASLSPRLRKPAV